MAQIDPIEQLSQPPGAAPVRGQFAPDFKARSSNNPTFFIDTVGGRFIVLCFFGSSHDAAGRAHLDHPLRCVSRGRRNLRHWSRHLHDPPGAPQ